MPERNALIVGSGFAELAADFDGSPPETEWGRASAPLKRIEIGSASLLMLARHGSRHEWPPHAINYRANIAALADAGARRVIALNTVGAVTTRCRAGGIAIPDQLMDYTWGRAHSFYDGAEAGVEHIEFTEPFDADLRGALLAAAARAGVDCVDGGVYAATQGPRLETAAEVDRLERDGADYVGMTAMPEAALAAERGLAYACIALVVNPAAGRGDGSIHADVASHTAATKSATMRLLESFFETGTPS